MNIEEQARWCRAVTFSGSICTNPAGHDGHHHHDDPWAESASIEEQARAEAEKRWPTPDHRATQEEYDAAIGWQGGFEEGAKWAATRTREVTTVAELDALPVGSVVLDAHNDAWQRDEVEPSLWVAYCHQEATSGDFVRTNALPARVLYVPEEGR